MQYKVCDAHCDTLSHLVSGGTLENATITPERLAAGGVSLQVFALFATYGRGIEPYEKARRMLSAAGEFPVPMLTGALPDALPESPTLPQQWEPTAHCLALILPAGGAFTFCRGQRRWPCTAERQHCAADCRKGKQERKQRKNYRGSCVFCGQTDC